MRRILILNTDLEVGGTPTVVRDLATRLHAPQDGVHVEVACVGPWGPVADQITAAGVEVTALDADDVYDLPVVVKRLVKLLRDRRIDTLFSFLVHANTVAAVASRFAKDVRLVQAIQTTQPRPRWHWWVQSMVQAAAAAVVVPSASVAQVAEAEAGVPRAKLVIIPNAIDADDLRLEPVQRSDGPARAVFLGRLDPIKRLGDLVEAMTQLRDRVTLDVYGDGEEWDAVQRQIDRHGLGEVVRLHGAVPRQQALAGADVLVLPSEAEGFPLVLLEAMAAGVAIVATDAPGIRDVICHERTGLLVPVGQPNALATAVARMVGDPVLRRQLIQSAATEVRERYGWPRVLELYRQVLQIR